MDKTMINLYHCQFLPISFSHSSSSSSLSPSRISLQHHRHHYMARSMHRALIRTCQVPRPLVSSIKKSSTTSHRLVAFRTQSSQSERVESNVVVESSDSETLAVQSIEDAIHRIIERRSAPDWLPFVPGSSYWVPPRKPSYGIADLVEKLANSLTDEEVMSLATTRGWPSSSFFVNDTSPDPAEVESTSTCTSQSVDEEG